jgi:hypothetical protein
MKKFWRIALPTALVGVIVFGALAVLATHDAVAGKGGKGGGGDGDKCPRTGIFCLDVWDPVICDDGNVYSNSCYAYVACATGCEPYGDGGPVPVEF